MDYSNLSELVVELDRSALQPRDRLRARLGKIWHEIASDRPSSDDTYRTLGGLIEKVIVALHAIPRYETPVSTKLLTVLNEYCQDHDFVVELLYRGGFRALRALFDEREWDDTIVAARDSLAETITARGFSIFQSRAVLDDRVIDKLKPLVYRFQVDEAPVMEIYLRQVPGQQESQFTVGYLLWSAAIILARMLCAHPEWVSQKSVLELGAGLGLSGIVASRWASRVVLTDYNPTILENLRYNVLINQGATADDAAVQCPVQVARLDWDHILDANSQGEDREPIEHQSESYACRPLFEDLRARAEDPFDVIIASDVICQQADALGVARALQAFLGTELNSVAHIVLPTPANRFGVDAFRGALDNAGLTYSVAAITEETLLDGIEEREYFRWDHYRIWKKTQPTAAT